LSKAAEFQHVQSLAVMPLVNVNADPDLEYLADGIAENIINTLSDVSELRVIPRSTVFRRRGEQDPAAVGRALGANLVLSGQLVKASDRLIVSTELIDVARESQIWGGRYNRRSEDLFELEEEVAKEISQQLKLKLASTGQKLVKHSTKSVDAYHAYLKGRHFWNKRTVEGLEKSIEWFERAIEIDSQYALAYSGIADSYIVLGSFGIAALPPTVAFSAAQEAAEKALELDEGLAEAHSALGFALANYKWDWEASRSEFLRAIELKPSYATAHHWYAFVYLAPIGRLDEAIEVERHALELEPLSLIINTNLGTLLYLARKYDLAIEQYQRALEIDPQFIIAHWMLALSYEQKSLFAQAIAELETAVSLSGGSGLTKCLLGHANALTGDENKARAMLTELIELREQVYVSSYRIASINAALGDKQEAFIWFDRAVEERDCWLLWLKVDPVLDDLRPDSRLQKIINRVGL
jgi:TolB-like protein/Tfp pilus assembly protein PilF